jgi:hypothetical protein
MAVGLPAKTTYVDGDVFSASDINDTNGTLNLVGQTTNFYAGKNRIINGDFAINQRKFTSVTTSGVFSFDRWLQFNVGGTHTITPQTFTPGAAPVAGYEGTNFVQSVVASQSATGDYAAYSQKIEDVRTFANQTVTISFWARATSGTPKISNSIQQAFGTGGSPSSGVITKLSPVTISTSWARYSVTANVPSISGKTIGTNNDSSLILDFWFSAGSDISAFSDVGIQNNTFQIWGVQIEAGSAATAFQTATGTIQGELAACQRYFQVIASGLYKAICNAMAYTNTSVYGIIHLNTQMRTTPTISQVTGTNFYSIEGNATADAFDSIAGLNYTSEGRTGISVTSGIATTQGFSYWIFTNNASAFLALQAEL